MAVLAVMLLGAGERWRADPRFRSPGATLDTYWQALRNDDVFPVWQNPDKPEADLDRMLLDQLRLRLPKQPPPRISATMVSPIQ